MIEPLPQRNTKRFQVALSFAGEHRSFVEGVAEHLSRKLGQNRVFYDRYYEAELARPNLDTYLTNIYREDADLIVIFLCANYAQKEWCGLEWRVIRDVLKQRRDSEIMPFKFDDVIIEGLLSIDGYIDITHRTPEEVAGLILQRIDGKGTFPLHSSKSKVSAVYMESSSHLSLSPASLIQSAKAAHPAFKYATVVAGLAAIVAVVLQFGISPATLVFGIIILIILMVVFFVFAQAVTVAKAKLALPALVLTWTFLLLGVGTGVCLFSSAFFDAPLPLKTTIIRSLSTSPGGKTGEVPTPAVPTRQLLSGVIWDDHHETVAEVEVFVPEFNVTTFTDRQGKFVLEVQATSQRQVRLIAHKEGYEPRVEDPTLGNTSLSFVLRRKP